jgi:hypothetical protein
MSSFYSLDCTKGNRIPWKSVAGAGSFEGSIFFALSAALGKILTLDNFRKQHIIVMNKCCICKRNGEMVDHLLLHCEVAFALWNAIFSHFGMSWVMLRRVFDLFAYWWSSGKRSAVVWKMVRTHLF